MTVPTTMKALEVTSLTGPENMQLIDRPVPKPGPGEVLVKVSAAGMNYSDAMQSRGTYDRGPTPPYIPGFESSGEVVAHGDGDIPFAIGSKVIAFGQGTFAQYIACNAMTLQPLPKGWSAAQGAAVGANWYTAYAAVKLIADLQPGQRVLIHAAAGGVGQAAIRLAKHFGARVFATASTQAKLQIATALGADETINYLEQDFVEEVKQRTEGRGVDVILESVGGSVFRKNFEAVVPYGKIIVYGLSSGQRASIDNWELLFRYPVQLIGLNMALQTELMGKIFPALGALIESKVIDPQEPTKHALADGPRVLLDLETRKTVGKHVLEPWRLA